MKKVIEKILTDSSARSADSAEKIALATEALEPWGGSIQQ